MTIRPTPLSRGFIADLVLGLLAIIIGLWLALDGYRLDAAIHLFASKITVYFIALGLSLIVSKSTLSVWRWTTLDDLLRVLNAAALSAAIYSIFGIIYFKSLNFLEPLLASFFIIAFLMGARGFVRLTTSGGDFRSLTALLRPVSPNAPSAILIGSTNVVSSSLHETRKLGPLPFRPIAIVSTLGNHINKIYAGAKVYDGSQSTDIVEKLVKSAQKQNNEVRIVLVGDDHPEKMTQAVMGVIAKTGAKISRLPEIGAKELSNVSPSDVLGRKKHFHDDKAPSRLIRHKTVLITGAGGTIGSELALQIAKFGPGRLILLDSSENNLHSISIAVSEQFPALNTISRMVDIREKDQIDNLFEKYNPQIVLHAAANKHVPLLESHPREAIRVNLGGTKILADAAMKCGTEVFILISTDKAVNPSNIMGAAKRAAELYVRHCFEARKGGFYSVRFGNVLGSSGSVMPLFERQISKMGPVTLTHNEMTRWFMTVEEAAGLVLQGAALGGGAFVDEVGNSQILLDPLLVLDMGEPMRIREFAEAMIRLRGLEPDIDIKIVETGIRPGEKLHEELFYTSEHVSATRISGVLCARPTAPLPDDLVPRIDNLLSLAQENRIEEAISELQEIVPQFEKQTSYKSE